jgi:hypothetical protein
VGEDYAKLIGAASGSFDNGKSKTTENAKAIIIYQKMENALNL